MLILYFAYVILLNPQLPPGTKIRVTIKSGFSTSQIAEILTRKKLIPHPLVFKLIVKYNNVERKLIAGEYDFRSGMSLTEIIQALKKGPVRKIYKVTIPEGLTINQTADLIAQKTKVDEEEFKQLATTGAKNFKYEFLVSNPSVSLEGYLFPKTYEILEKSSVSDIINIMLAQFARETASLELGLTKLTKHQVVIIASLIEREAKIAEERGLIAAVIYNRLQRMMPLQIDATVQYALPTWKMKLTREDLKVDSPYNTYMYPGLPPGPIANPGLASIKAALNPAKVDYLYYVVTSPDGRHTFTNSYEEFLRAKEKAKKELGN